MDNVNIEVIDGVGKDSKKPYQALKITIGDWDSGLIFVGSDRALVRTKFEFDHIKQVLSGDYQPNTNK